MSIFGFSSFGQVDSIKLDSKVTDVKVFFSGAQVFRSAQLNLQAGKYIIEFPGLSPELQDNGVQVSSVKNLNILSVKTENKLPNAGRKTAQELKVEDEVEVLEEAIEQGKNEIAALDIERKIILDNADFVGEKGAASISELKAASVFYREKLNEISKRKQRVRARIRKKGEALQTKFAELNKLVVDRLTPKKVVIVGVEVTQAINQKIHFNYLVQSAGWKPMYDFRVTEVDEPLQIDYKAFVYQSTQEDWSKVNLTLSSNNPSTAGEKPVMEPWILGIQRQTQTSINEPSSGSGTLKGKILDAETGEPLPFVNIVLEKDGQNMGGTTSNFDGEFTIKPIGAGRYNLLVSFVGYATQKNEGIVINGNKITFWDVQLSSGIDLDEFEVVKYVMPLIDKDGGASGGTVYSSDIARMPARSAASVATTVGGVSSRGSRPDATNYYIDGIKVMGSNSLPQSSIHEVNTITGGTPANYGSGSGSSYSENRYSSRNSEQPKYRSQNRAINNVANSLSETATYLEYNIEVPYTIPSDGNDYSISIKTVYADVDYKYTLFPKIDQNAFLSAEIADWESMKFLSGTTNNYFNGTFTGEGFVDANFAQDTLSVYLGKDKGITVNRVLNKKMYERKVLGSNLKETIAWDIEIRNNKSSSIEVHIEDQIPLSQFKDTDVDLIENPSNTLDPKTGILSWDATLAPGDKKSFPYQYTVKYPSYRNFFFD
ncbi:MAG: hypothetical protein ACI9YL_002103 [Luteibaculaceae bacterium]|jgi:hypothetical protein